MMRALFADRMKLMWFLCVDVDGGGWWGGGGLSNANEADVMENYASATEVRIRLYRNRKQERLGTLTSQIKISILCHWSSLLGSDRLGAVRKSPQVFGCVQPARN